MSQRSSDKYSLISQLSLFLAISKQLKIANKVYDTITYNAENQTLLFQCEVGQLILKEINLDELESGSYSFDLFTSICKLQEDTFKLKKTKLPHYYKVKKIKVRLEKYTQTQIPFPEQEAISQYAFDCKELKTALAISDSFLKLNNTTSELSVINGTLYATDRQRFFQTKLADTKVSFSLPLEAYKAIVQLCSSCSEPFLSLTSYPSFILFETLNLSFFCFILNKDLSTSMLPVLKTHVSSKARKINLNLETIKQQYTDLNSIYKSKNLIIHKQGKIVKMQLESNLAESSFEEQTEDNFNIKLSSASLSCLFNFKNLKEVNIYLNNKMLLVNQENRSILVAGMS